MKVVSVNVSLSRNLWQCLVVMAAQDVREPENFISWLVSREAQRRGLLPADSKAQAEGEPAQSDSVRWLIRNAAAELKAVKPADPAPAQAEAQPQEAARATA